VEILVEPDTRHVARDDLAERTRHRPMIHHRRVPPDKSTLLGMSVHPDSGT
jgi:hypothetical protein